MQNMPRPSLVAYQPPLPGNGFQYQNAVDDVMQTISTPPWPSAQLEISPSSAELFRRTDTMGLGGSLSNIKHLLSAGDKLAIQAVTVTAATISLAACVVSLYWFLLLQRNFRRTLIMLLLFSDLWKSFWYMLFPIVSMSVGGIQSGTPFCDASGFFIQVGIEACDYSILVMSIHMSMQVFQPKEFFGPDGLYRVRHAVFALWILLPVLMSGLAFINTQGAYLSQGAFCSLPVRPFWYRLALSWIPRYLIWGYVIFTAIRIYIHAESGFHVLMRRAAESSSEGRSSMSNTAGRNSRAQTIKSSNITKSIVAEKDDDIAEPDADHNRPQVLDRRPSAIRFDIEKQALSDSEFPDNELQLLADGERPIRGADRSMQSGCSISSYADNDASSRIAMAGSQAASGTASKQSAMLTDQTTTQRRKAVRRQVRMLFIYPCVYMVMLIIPFISHCLSYSDYYAEHPPFALGLLSTICWSGMGAADCLCFTLREKPWLHIHGSDGTFWGSFKLWKILAPDDISGPSSPANLKQSHCEKDGSVAPGERRPGSSGSARRIIAALRNKKPPGRRNGGAGGGSDRAAKEAEIAAIRLQLEREDRATSLYHKSATTSPTKEWFDRPLSMISQQGHLDRESSSSEHLEAAPMRTSEPVIEE